MSVHNILFIDAGNTRIKWLFNQVMSVGSFEQLSDYVLQKKSCFHEVRIACVCHQDALSRLFSDVDCLVRFAYSDQKCLGLTNGYKDALQLGVDRWLAMLAVWCCHNKKGFIIMDSGTATTVDVVNDQGMHLGGYIVPGFDMSKKALECDTDRINPLFSSFPASLELGLSTDQAVLGGMLTQTVTLLNHVQQRYPSWTVFLSGGYADYLKGFVCDSHIIKNAVIEGLKRRWDIL